MGGMYHIFGGADLPRGAALESLSPIKPPPLDPNHIPVVPVGAPEPSPALRHASVQLGMALAENRRLRDQLRAAQELLALPEAELHLAGTTEWMAWQASCWRVNGEHTA
jgi:hypothetical protein